ncbi:MAG TPA: hypothetical protein VKB79_23810 [Bryobacteraceae bacterium]|nr:hypothetical protein [Bryobacteraceae bacterium]
MADDPLSTAVETFSAPIENLITALGQGIAQAQRAMDLNSIATQEQLDTDPVLSQYHLQATWYQFPSATLELKLSLSISEDQSSSPNSAPSVAHAAPRLTVAQLQLRNPVRLIAQPVSASYQTHFNYDAQAASTISVNIVPVPPPVAPDQVTVPPRMQPADVQTTALASPAKFVTVMDSQGKPTPAATDAAGNALRFEINFNSTARLWYVLQYAPSNSAVNAIVVAVDDATASVRVISTT